MVKLFCLTNRKSGNQLWQLGSVHEIYIFLRGHVSFPFEDETLFIRFYVSQLYFFVIFFFFYMLPMQHSRKGFWKKTITSYFCNNVYASLILASNWIEAYTSTLARSTHLFTHWSVCIMLLYPICVSYMKFDPRFRVCFDIDTW